MDGARKRKVCGIPVLNLLLPVFIFLQASGASADGNVTLDSITIYNTHEWFGLKPRVYFRCGQESKVYLPDVVKKDEPYLFVGLESWQPLTTLYGEKCKRCGFYEEDTVKADDTFYEGELCPGHFTTSLDGHLILFEKREFNASLFCPDCVPQSAGSQTSSPGDEDEEDGEKGAGIAFLIIVLVFVVLFALGVVAYTKWRQKLRRDQQARFVKMFEDDDDLDAELGLKDDL